MPYVVDTIEVEPEVVARYLETVAHLGVPVMTDAGSCVIKAQAHAIRRFGNDFIINGVAKRPARPPTRNE